MILDQTAERVSRGWDEVLVICACNEPRLRSGDLRLYRKIHQPRVSVAMLRTYEGNGYSSHRRQSQLKGGGDYVSSRERSLDDDA